MSSESINRRNLTRPYLAPFEINTIIQDVQATQHPDVWSGNAGGSGLSIKPDLEEEHPIWIGAQHDLPPLGVFYAKTGWGQDNSRAAGLDELTSANLSYDLFLTTRTGVITGSSTEAWIIGTHRPHRVMYDESYGDPVFGDSVGVVPGTYKVGKNLEGLLAVSDGNTTDHTVWVIRNAEASGKGIRLLQLTETLYPGSIAGAVVVLQVDGVWSLTTSCAIQDVQHKSFGLEGDLIWATRTGITSDGVYIYEAIGENGLEQFGRTPAEIECNAEGNFAIRHGDIDKDVTNQSLSISDKTLAVYGAARVGLVSVGSCNFESSVGEIAACPAPGFSRKIFAGEKVRLKYSTSNRRWVYYPVPEHLFCNAQLTDDMCTTANKLGDITELVGNLCKNDVIIPPAQTFTNPYNLRCKAGDDVYAQFDGLNSWRIIQVLHYDETIILESYWDPDTCALKYVEQDTVIQKCVEKSPPLGDPIGTEIDVIVDIEHPAGSGENCDTAYPVYRSIRALCPSSPSIGIVPIVEWGEAAFLIDVYDNGSTIMGCWMTVNVPLCGRSTDCEPLMDVDPCTSGSGGSGSGG